jgi:hypothetical protein
MAELHHLCSLISLTEDVGGLGPRRKSRYRNITPKQWARFVVVFFRFALFIPRAISYFFFAFFAADAPYPLSESIRDFAVHRSLDFTASFRRAEFNVMLIQ